MTISAKIIAHSKSAITGKEIITWELEYQRFIHAEFMTHRVFSRNAASSRAIPVAAVIKQVRENPAMPIHWGQNQPGMQAKEELPVALKHSAQFLWKRAAKFAATVAEGLIKIGLHKQATNRLLEPFQLIKVVMTTTEDDNWFWLRYHADAQPEIKELARLMIEAKANSEPAEIDAGDWHMPYFGGGVWLNGCGIPLEDALAISASCCAQVSYRKLDDTLEKAQMVYQRLVGSEPVHASPFEHQATPMEATNKWDCTDDGVNVPKMPWTWEEGITHIDRKNNFWSGNFKNWIQHRQLIPDNVCNNYVPSTKEQE